MKMIPDLEVLTKVTHAKNTYSNYLQTSSLKYEDQLTELKKMGFAVLGDNDSPVMSIMLYNPAKIPAFSRECLKQKVSDGFPVKCYFCSECCFSN
jgi:hypothetical protein